MRKGLIRRGIPLYPHAAQRIRQTDYENADYIFFMDDENYYSLLRQIDDYKHILFRINKYTPGRYEIEDPWYTGRYEKVCDQITDCIHDIFANI
jgi:protein-tyrosine-phosphatase